MEPIWAEKIHRWEDQLGVHEWVVCGPTEMDKAVVVTLARELRGQPPMPDDPLGLKARDLING